MTRKKTRRADIAIEAALKLAKQLKMETPVLDALQYARLKVVARIGELVPAEKGGRGKNSAGHQTGFGHDTLAAYRKVARNKPQIEAYYKARQQEQKEGDVSDVGMSIAGFLRYVGSGGPRRNLSGGIDETAIVRYDLFR